jgi:HPt (histidine-containing phosphotransfer) domain-containing protein
MLLTIDYQAGEQIHNRRVLRLENNDTTSDLPSNQRQRPNLKPGQGWARLMSEYLQDLPRQLNAIRAIVEIEDYTEIKKQAHRIKGTSGTYRLDAISKSAAQLEQSADAQNPDKIATALNNIVSLVKMESNRLNSQAVLSSGSSERTANG